MMRSVCADDGVVVAGPAARQHGFSITWVSMVLRTDHARAVVDLQAATAADPPLPPPTVAPITEALPRVTACSWPCRRRRSFFGGREADMIIGVLDPLLMRF